MSNRDRALDAENGIILDEESGGVHLSSGSATPTHVGKAGDWFFKTDGSRYYLVQDGSGWVKEERNYNFSYHRISDAITIPQGQHMIIDCHFELLSTGCLEIQDDSALIITGGL